MSGKSRPEAWRPPTQPFSSSSRPTRSRISPAALFVKVTARIDSGLTPCLRMSHVMRLTTALVLPLPAPATIARGALGVLDRLALLRVQGVEKCHPVIPIVPGGWTALLCTMGRARDDGGACSMGEDAAGAAAGHVLRHGVSGRPRHGRRRIPPGRLARGPARTEAGSRSESEGQGGHLPVHGGGAQATLRPSIRSRC